MYARFQLYILTSVETVRKVISKFAGFQNAGFHCTRGSIVRAVPTVHTNIRWNSPKSYQQIRWFLKRGVPLYARFQMYTLTSVETVQKVIGKFVGF